MAHEDYGEKIQLKNFIMVATSSTLSPYFRVIIRKYRRLGVSSRTWATPKVWPIFVPSEVGALTSPVLPKSSNPYSTGAPPNHSSVTGTQSRSMAQRQ